jgi:tripartite-type tricarboxylate transporter receptor subunit TctC
MRSGFVRPIAAAIAAAGLGIAASPAGADDIADFYGGRTLTVVVPVTPGGTFHLYGQLVQSHIGRFIPGNPTVILQNRPGAGGVTSNAFMANAAPRDGTVFAEINPGTMTYPLVRPSHYDPRTFEWIGSVAVRGYVGAVWHTVETDTIDKMKKTQVILGATGTGSQNYQIPMLMNHLIGTKFKLVTGYKGGGEVNLAIERGEVQGRANFYEGFVGATPQWIQGHKLKFFFVVGPPVPELPNVPRLKDVITSKEGRQMLNLIDSTLQIGQAFFLPPGTPKARVDAMTAAFARMVKDKDFLVDAEKRRLMIAPKAPPDIRKEIAEAYATPPAIVKDFAHILGLDQARGGKKGKKKS